MRRGHSGRGNAGYKGMTAYTTVRSMSTENGVADRGWVEKSKEGVVEVKTPGFCVEISAISSRKVLIQGIGCL